MNITIQTIPHDQQRYDTAGDWFYVGDVLHIRVSKMSDWRYEILLTEHELREAILCEHEGITQKQVDEFDAQWLKKNRDRPEEDDREPGDDPEAPYRRPHFRATTSERQLADDLGVNWQEYESEINAL